VSRRALGVALVLLVGACRPSPPRPENLVLVVVDTLRQDRVHAYGYPREQTPFLDGLAAAGCRADGRASTSWTRPSTATILSGLHPLEHQVIAPNDLLPAAVPLLSEELAAAGFATLAVTANSVIARKWGFGRGFDAFVDLQQELGRLPTAEEVVARVAPLLDGLASPYFLYVHLMDPHLPYDPERGWDGGELGEEAQRARPVTEAFFAGPEAPPIERRLRVASELYDGEVRRADDGVRALWSELERRGRTRGTLLAVTADHGEELLDHGGFSHGRTLYGEVLRVPLVLSGPGVAPGSCREAGAFPLEDLAPTLRALFGLPRPAGEAGLGRSRAAALAGEVAPGDGRGLLGLLDFAEGAALSFERDGAKLILGAVPYRKEWFDLESDPAERRDLFGAGGPPQVRDELARSLAADYNRLARNARERSSTRDPEIVAQLQALGYLGAASKPRHDRRFPPRIAPADALPGGLRGWEGAAQPGPCAERDGTGARQELFGWSELEQGDAAAAAVFVSRPGRGAGRLAVRGVSERESPVELAWSLDGEPVGATTVGPGAFEIALDVESGEGGAPAVVGISVVSPAAAGPGNLRLRSICLEPR